MAWDLPKRFYRKSSFSCTDCGVSTGMLGHYYMVSNEMWAKYGVETGMLCLPCLEQRIGRPLNRMDFPIDVPLNEVTFLPVFLDRDGWSIKSNYVHDKKYEKTHPQTTNQPMAVKPLPICFEAPAVLAPTRL